MAIRRIIFETDDRGDSPSGTSAPHDLAERDLPKDPRLEGTSAPSEKDEETQLAEGLGEEAAPSPLVGRTAFDLFSELRDDPRPVSATLFFVPFVPFVLANNVDGVADLIYPAIVGLSLNLLWFVLVPILSWAKNRLGRS